MKVCIFALYWLEGRMTKEFPLSADVMVALFFFLLLLIVKELMT